MYPVLNPPYPLQPVVVPPPLQPIPVAPPKPINFNPLYPALAPNP